MRSACGMERPVTPSRPAKMIGSMAPSSSGRATCRATCTGCRPSSESFHSSKVWKVAGTAHRYGRLRRCSVAMALGWSCVAGPPTSAKPVRLIITSMAALPAALKKYESTQSEKSSEPVYVGKAAIDVMINLTGFALVGGPATQDHPKAIATLQRLNRPYLCAVPATFQTFEEWKDSELGLHPVQVALQVALPELDGAIEPIIFASRDGVTGRSIPQADRIDVLCKRAIKWARLRRKENKDKKVAVTVFSFPPDKGNVGTAAYLNVFGSIFEALGNLKKEGYEVGELPESVEALVDEILHDKEARIASPELNVAYKMTVPEDKELTPYAADLEENWGPPPGNLNSDGQNLLIYGKTFGNIFIGVQPSFGYEGDPMRLLYAKSASPHHGFAAYYTYVEKVFDADAVLHFGTHGSLEFMPGKQVGMAGTCYPDRLIQSIPNLYYYAANNPSEATIAKRRSYATTISYLTPTSTT